MKFKKIRFSTQLSELYGRDNYQSHIEEGREYWWFFTNDDDISYGWHKIKITYIRSGCAFYVFPDLPDINERFFPISCFMASTLVFADFDPTKDLKTFGNDELAQKMYCFNDERTIVKNWHNEEIIEVDDNDSNIIRFYLLCKAIND